jgi:crossover junction endodeoxyribonuclease RuvC
MGLDIHEYAPKKIKMSVTGNGNASKEQVALMLQSILKVKLKIKELDATDALATAFTHYNQMSSPLAATGNYKSWASFAKANQHKVK